MTELDIERERREFEAWYFDSGESGCKADRRDAEEGMHAAFKQLSFSVWIAAKRAVLGSAEPVATIRFERGTPGKENDMPSVASCNWMPDGDYAVYTAPPAPVSAEPVNSAQSILDFMDFMRTNGHGHLLARAPDRKDGEPMFANSWGQNMWKCWQKSPSAPPSTNAKDREDAARYRWLRDGNAYVPEEEQVHGYGALDELCDRGIAKKESP